MEILEAYDLTGSFRAAAGLVGCDHKTVAYWVRQREEAGGMPVVERARPAMEPLFAEKIDELFMWAFAHPPAPAQRQMALAHIDQHAKDKKSAYENILWALLNTKEFVFNE